MTGAGWPSGYGSAALYQHLNPRWSGDEPNPQPRKCRLLWVAWARHRYPRLPWVYRLMTDYAERLADGLVPVRSELRTALRSAGADGITYCQSDSARLAALTELEAVLKTEFGLRPTGDEPSFDPVSGWGEAYDVASAALYHQTPPVSWFPASTLFESYFRDVYGNSFHPMIFPPDWRTPTAVALAARMYESRDFTAMPILADALQDAGCDDDVLAHCRDPKATHVRGCWVVDAVLGKE